MCDTTDSHIGVINVCVNLACYKFICWTNNRNFITSYLTPCMLQKVVSYIYVPESSKGLKFEPLNHQKQTWGLKFDTLGGSRYIYIYIYTPRTPNDPSFAWSLGLVLEGPRPSTNPWAWYRSIAAEAARNHPVSNGIIPQAKKKKHSPCSG